MEQQFKVGDIVTIADLNIHSRVHYGVNDEMETMSGMQAIITKTKPNAYTPNRTDEDGCLYEIDIDNGHWKWSNRMFVIDASLGKFKISDEDFE